MADAAPEKPAWVHTWVTYVAIAASVVMFGIELASGAHYWSPESNKMIELGASTQWLTLDGQWWRLVSSMFLHFGILHLALNMVCLWQGRVVEMLYGRLAFAVIYLLAGLAGGIAALLGTLGVIAGASGAVFGVYGAFAAFLVFRKDVIPEQAWKNTARGIGMFVVLNLAFGLSVPGISVAAHVGGLLAGFLAGAAMLWRGTERRPTLQRTIVVAVAAVAVVVGALIALPKPAAPTNPIAEFAGVEETVVAKLNAIEQQRAAGALDDGKAAYQLEHEVLVPWRTACAKLAAVDPIERARSFVAALVDYCNKRQESWETFGAALVATGDTKEGLLTRYRFQQVEVRKLAGVVERESEKLEK